jgi:5-formyltetrahydrofolate cyclo-ligase
MSERQELRRHYRRKRNALTPEIQNLNAEAVAKHFFASGLGLRAKTIGAYFAEDAELDLSPLIMRLLAAKKRLAMPVVRADGIMEFYRYRRNGRLVLNRYGIPEPAPGAAFVSPLSIDLLLVPLVAFDRFGMRLGMGAGFYDRFLGRIPERFRPLLVGIAHETQRCMDPLPFEDWDIPLNGVVTEAGWQALPE